MPYRARGKVLNSRKMEQTVMDKTIRKVTDVRAQRAETYRYWQDRSPAERFEATWELSRDLYREFYRQKGAVPNGEGSTRSVTRVQRAGR